MIKILSVVAMPLCLAALVLAGASIWVAALEQWMLPLLLAALVLMAIDVALDIQATPGHDEDETCEECER